MFSRTFALKIPQSPKSAVVAAAAVAVSTALLAGCSSGAGTTEGGAAGGSENALRVVATTTQICDYVTQIASGGTGLVFNKTASDGSTSTTGTGDAELDLTCLLAPNASAHEHEMTKQQMKALADADLMLVSGVDLEHFLDQAVSASGFHGTMVVTSGILTASEVGGDIAAEKDLPYKIDRGVEKVKVEKWPFPPEEGESEPEFQYDPHIWTSPANVKVQVKNIGAAFDDAQPANAALFDEHVADYERKLDDLNAWVKQSLDSVPAEHRVLFSSHDAFGYFSKTYGVKFIGAALSDFNAQQDATAAHISQEAQKVKDSGAVALFAENSNNSKSVEAIAKAAGVKAVIGDDALYGDSLGPDGSAGATYIGSIIHNVTTLVQAWDGTVAPLPASLQSYAQ